jgi:hypothetical protein
MKFATMAEIVRDETLSGVWGVAVGYHPADAFQTRGGDNGLPAKVHKSSRILFLSVAPTEGSEKCSECRAPDMDGDFSQFLLIVVRDCDIIDGTCDSPNCGLNSHCCPTMRSS